MTSDAVREQAARLRARFDELAEAVAGMTDEMRALTEALEHLRPFLDDEP